MIHKAFENGDNLRLEDTILTPDMKDRVILTSNNLKLKLPIPMSENYVNFEKCKVPEYEYDEYKINKNNISGISEKIRNSINMNIGMEL